MLGWRGKAVQGAARRAVASPRGPAKAGEGPATDREGPPAMFHLLLATCLSADPATCAERLLPAADAPDLAGCRDRAEAVARDWIARHPGLTGGATRCVPTAALPALPVDGIAPGVHLFRGVVAQLSPANQGRIANLAFVVGDSVAVIDAGGTRAEGEALYAAIRARTDRPISHVILTHMHPDHILGAEVFAEAGARIATDARLPAAVSQRAPGWMRSIPDQIGQQAFLGSRIAPVDDAVAAPTRIALGTTTLTLLPQPAAHTGNDLVVQDEASGVLFTGDLVFRGLTPAIDGSLAGWLDWIAAGPPAGLPPARLIVPGHGPVALGWSEAVGPESRYLSALRDSARQAVAAGMGLGEAIPAIVAMMRPLADGWADYEPTTARNAATAFSEAEWE